MDNQFDVRGVNLTESMNGWRLVVFLYHVDNYEIFETVADKIELLACSQETGIKFDGMSEVQKFAFPVTNESVHAVVSYTVDKSGWTDSQIFICSEEEEASTEMLDFVGTMEIRNPYGLLPAPLYGMLPFSGFLSIGYVVLDVFFAFLLYRHRQQVIHLHYGILFVLCMGTVAASIWFYAFYRMNKTGEPVCCPYPTIFLVSVIFDVRILLAAAITLAVAFLVYCMRVLMLFLLFVYLLHRHLFARLRASSCWSCASATALCATA